MVLWLIVPAAGIREDRDVPERSPGRGLHSTADASEARSGPRAEAIVPSVGASLGSSQASLASARPATVLAVQRAAGNRAAAAALRTAKLARALTPEQQFAVTNDGRVEDIQEFVGGVPQVADEDLDEFILWNFLVNGAEVRQGHAKEIDPVATRWAQELTDDPNLRIRILGYASTSGTDDINEPLALSRAESVRQHLIGLGVPEPQIVIDSSGSRLPMRIGQSPEDLARNRRVEISKFFATTAKNSLADLAPNTSVTVDAKRLFVPAGVLSGPVTAPIPNVSEGDNQDLVFRNVPTTLQVDVQFTSSDPTVELSVIQFLEQDIEQALYQGGFVSNATGPLNLADWSSCLDDFAPCRDVAAARLPFSRDPGGILNAASPSGAPTSILFSSTPSTSVPLFVVDVQPGQGRANLRGVRWERLYTMVLVARKGDLVVPVKHWRWGFRSLTKVTAAEGTSVGISVLDDAGFRNQATAVDGAPPGLDIERAMSLPTCHFRELMLRGGACGPAFTDFFSLDALGPLGRVLGDK